MRNYKVEVNGTVYIAAVEAKGNDKFRVTVNGEIFETEPMDDERISTWAVRSGDDLVRVYCIVQPDDKVDVWVDGVPFSNSVQPAHAIEGVEKPSGHRFSDEIRALMPGRVTSILVKEGESVQVGSPLLILEAMKMQNEITSPAAGRVKKILVKEGEIVKKDAALISVV